MPIRTLSQERIDWILSRVEAVGSTDRKPDGSDPATWDRQGQMRRFGGAYPKDLGARRRDQSITHDMKQMVGLGYLDTVPGLYFPGFVIAKRSTN